MGTKQRQGDNDERRRVKILCCTAERQIPRLRFGKGDNRGLIGETGREMRRGKRALIRVCCPLAPVPLLFLLFHLSCCCTR